MSVAPAAAPFDLSYLRIDFPLLGKATPEGRPLVYLDSGATSQKPNCVIDKVCEVWREYNSNVHRGVHSLGDRVTGEFENARETVRALINAPDIDEVVFTSGTTNSINLVAHGWGRKFLKPGDEIALTDLEHHANLVPWQQVAAATGARLTFLPLTDDGRLDVDAARQAISPRTKLIAITGMSNVLGTVIPIAEVAQLAQSVGALTLVDGAQSVPHAPVDVQALNIDFLAFSGHKIYGPTGIGILWGRRSLLEAMDPFLGGGNMIRRVFRDRFEPGDLPAKFEAGTPPIAEAVGLGTAIEYMNRIGLEQIAAWEAFLTQYAWERLSAIEGLRVLGPEPGHRGSIVSFVVDGIQANDLASVLDTRGIAVRAGHHCTMPLHDRLGISASVRASLAFYNIPSEIDSLVAGIEQGKRLLRRR